jgi:hypothetical protein
MEVRFLTGKRRKVFPSYVLVDQQYSDILPFLREILKRLFDS